MHSLVRPDSDQLLNDERYFKHNLDMNIHYLAYLEQSSRAAPRGMWFEGISIWVMQLVFLICWLLISLNFGFFLSTGVLATVRVILMTGKAARKEVDSQSGRRLQTTVLSIEI